VVVVGLMATASFGQQYADILADYNPGDNVGGIDIGFGAIKQDNPQAAIDGPSASVLNSDDASVSSVSLGGWTRTGTEVGESVGLILGFSGGVTNDTGVDFKVVGNAPNFGFWEPGYVEVAVESDGGGATAGGWLDETFYLLKPSNYGALPHDPRTGPIAVDYAAQTAGEWDFAYSGTFETNNHDGWADFTYEGDAFNIDWAIDGSGNTVSLGQIAYIRMRTATDSSINYEDQLGAGVIDYFSAEIDYVENLNVIPEPATMALLATGVAAATRRRRIA